MIKILLADDEGIVIDALTYIIEKDFPGECQIESARNGRQMVERAEQMRPDIAFVDIHMPGINGIGAMREIRKTNPDVIFLVVSAYDQFDYAKEAMQLGVMEYLTKPIDREQIVRALREAMDRLSKNQERRRNELHIQEKLQIVLPIVETGLLYAMISRDTPPDELDNYISLLSIEKPCGNILVAKFGDADDRGQIMNGVGASIRLREQSEHIRSLLRRHFDCVPGALMGNMIAAFIPCDELTEEEAYARRIRQIEEARALIRELQKEQDWNMRIAFGGVEPIREANKSYRDALQAFAYSAGSRVVHAEDLGVGEEYEDYPITMEKPLFDAVRAGDLAAALSAADRFFDWMVAHHGDAMMDIRLKTLEFVMRIETIGYRNTGATYRFLSRSGYMEEVLRCDDPSSLRNWFHDRLTEVCRRITTARTDGPQDLIEKAKAYIHKQYKTDLSLDEISEELRISPYYFSKQFRSKTGMTFVEYLTELRMNKAKDLLRETDLPMKQVSAEVGYADQNYFSRIFRKQNGLSPTEYREQARSS